MGINALKAYKRSVKKKVILHNILTDPHPPFSRKIDLMTYLNSAITNCLRIDIAVPVTLMVSH